MGVFGTVINVSEPFYRRAINNFGKQKSKVILNEIKKI